ncbi:MAG: hypothetical protein AAF840_00500 [Bacteroidota bacterium]
MLLGLILGPILRDGMFLDGVVYTNIAKNLANGIGTMWSPLVFPDSVPFYENPVLLPWVESWFFVLLGDGLHTEDVYNFLVLAATIVVMYFIWRTLVPAKQRYLFFFPFLLWVLSQEVQLRYPNTMLECGLTLTLLLTAYTFLKAVPRHPNLSFGLVGLGVFIATLCKGPFGLFLLALPFLHQLVLLRRLNFTALLTPLLTTATCYAVLFYTQPEALVFWENYLHQQVFAAIKGERTENIANTRLDFLYWLIMLNLPAIVLAIVVSYLFRKTKSVRPNSPRTAWLLISMGVLAVLPLVISSKQAAYYQLPALPFFALGFSLLILPKIHHLCEWVAARRNALYTLSTVGGISIMITGFIAISMVGTTDRRDREVVEMAAAIATAMETQNVQDYNLQLLGNTESAAQRSYRLTNFLARYHNLNLNQIGTTDVELIIRHGGQQVTKGGQVFFWKDDVLLRKRR